MRKGCTALLCQYNSRRALQVCDFNQDRTEICGRQGRLIIWWPFKPIFFKYMFHISAPVTTYSGGTGFKSLPETGYPYWVLLWVSLVPLGKCISTVRYISDLLQWRLSALYGLAPRAAARLARRLIRSWLLMSLRQRFLNFHSLRPPLKSLMKFTPSPPE
jgi:hypothetical protein